ncbi:DUF721 domain-containing protein [Aeoliella sp. ICT_H6.2]|uniref:DUF721 domain-containing protein n=1 Tax=Aeoliella straminimaris TaxID=2954799 RepID=A0A9X2F6H6_9BACT|nr:DUF721 domain-containing protein [Aeoliella straminimaris]MCO6043145.1 DUF721 domain-containing protein [Aeoliella straminimaris]
MDEEELAQKLSYQMRRNDVQRRRFYGHEPQAIGKVLAKVVINNRYACGESNAALEEAWAKIVGQAFAARSQPTGIKRGKFEVTVAHSAISQELTFDQRRIVSELQKSFPEIKITGVRYRVGTIG